MSLDCERKLKCLEENPCMHGENTQNDPTRLRGSDPEASCCEVAVLTTAPLLYPLWDQIAQYKCVEMSFIMLVCCLLHCLHSFLFLLNLKGQHYFLIYIVICMHLILAWNGIPYIFKYSYWPKWVIGHFHMTYCVTPNCQMVVLLITWADITEEELHLAVTRPCFTKTAPHLCISHITSE